jgi:hypothetical protein
MFVRPFQLEPSSMITASRTSSRRRAISPASESRVRATNARDTDDRDVMRVARQRNLPVAVGAPNPGPFHTDTATAEGDFTDLMPMTDRRSVWIVSALRPHDLSDFFLHQFSEHTPGRRRR